MLLASFAWFDCQAGHIAAAIIGVFMGDYCAITNIRASPVQCFGFTPSNGVLRTSLDTGFPRYDVCIVCALN